MAKYIDIDEARNFNVGGETFDLVALVDACYRIPDEWWTPESVSELRVGQIVYVDAMGRLRRGVVTKLGRTRVTVAFTTAGSVNEVSGLHRTVRVADTPVSIDQIWVPAETPAETPAPRTRVRRKSVTETKAGNYILRSKHRDALITIMTLADCDRVRPDSHGHPVLVKADMSWAGNCRWEIDRLVDRDLVGLFAKAGELWYGLTNRGRAALNGALAATGAELDTATVLDELDARVIE